MVYQNAFIEVVSTSGRLIVSYSMPALAQHRILSSTTAGSYCSPRGKDEWHLRVDRKATVIAHSMSKSRSAADEVAPVSQHVYALPF